MRAGKPTWACVRLPRGSARKSASLVGCALYRCRAAAGSVVAGTIQACRTPMRAYSTRCRDRSPGGYERDNLFGWRASLLPFACDRCATPRRGRAACPSRTRSASQRSSQHEAWMAGGCRCKRCGSPKHSNSSAIASIRGTTSRSQRRRLTPRLIMKELLSIAHRQRASLRGCAPAP